MAATLKLTHKSIGVEVRRGAYDIVVDGQQAGSLAMNDCKYAMVETPAELRPSTLPRAKPLPSDAPERVFCRSSSRPFLCLAWPSNSDERPMIGPCNKNIRR